MDRTPEFTTAELKSQIRLDKQKEALYGIVRNEYDEALIDQLEQTAYNLFNDDLHGYGAASKLIWKLKKRLFEIK